MGKKEIVERVGMAGMSCSLLFPIFFRPSPVATRLCRPLLVMVLLAGWSLPAATPQLAAQTRLRSTSTDPDGTIGLINAQLRQTWQDYEVKPSPLASEGEWCRRVYLDVLGRIPSVDELDAFVQDKRSDKKARLVDRLLSTEYAEEYARNWTTIWTNILIGRTGGNDRRSPVYREGMQQYLRQSFRENKPYHRLVEELIAARGTSKPDLPGYNGAVNFLADKLGEDGAESSDPTYGVQATARTSQIFLGLRVQCTQCHDHPFNSWKQNQFWELNAFFRQAVALRRFGDGGDIAHIDMDNQDYQGPSQDPEEAEVYYELRNGVLQAAYPVFTDRDGSRTALGRSGFLDQVDRRSELARLVVNSGYLPVAMVNRLWAHFFSYGFTKPFDDLGPHNSPSQPELLEAVADRFRAGGYDIKQLIRWITLSEPYQLSSKFNATNQNDDPQQGNVPLFSRFYPRQMQAEQLYESLLVATDAHKTRGDDAAQAAAKKQWLDQFVIAFGTDENDETSTFNGTIPQILMMMNGDLIQRATSTQPGGFLQRVASDPKTNPRQKIQLLFKAALAREATSTERKAANTTLAGRANMVEALQDVWWVLLNTNEFILNH